MEPIIAAERMLTQTDYLRLSRLLVDRAEAIAGAEAMQELLDASELVSPRAVPPTVVTMYTQVLLQDTQRDAPPYKLTLCYPDDAAPSEGFISVLSPVGSALLGLCAGEVARWTTPVGPREARILAILFQPEATGDYET